MHKFALSLFTAIVIYLTVPNHVEAKNSKLDVGAGYRQDYLMWELAGHDDNPPVLSRLTWKQLRIFELTAQYKKITCQKIYVRANADYGRIFHGRNQDSDYREADDTDDIIECSRSNNNAGKGEVWDLSGGVGYFFRFEGDFCKLRIVPIVGYSINEQHLRIFNGFQTIDLDTPEAEGHHFHHLNSSYQTRWKGPWAGADVYFHFNEKITINGTFEYHWVNYHGSGHWNLRDDFAGNFTHTGNGKGYFGTFGVDYNFCSGWYLGGLFRYNYASLKNGKDRTPVTTTIAEGILPNRAKAQNDDSGSSSSDVPITLMTEGKLRRIVWHSFSILFTAGYNF